MYLLYRKLFFLNSGKFLGNYPLRRLISITLQVQLYLKYSKNSQLFPLKNTHHRKSKGFDSKITILIFWQLARGIYYFWFLLPFSFSGVQPVISRVGEISWNREQFQGTSINILHIFLRETLETALGMRNLSHGWTQSGYSNLKIAS